MRGGELKSDVTRGVGAPELVRQPRGDGEVASRGAVDDFDFDFSELSAGHSSPKPLD